MRASHGSGHNLVPELELLEALHVGLRELAEDRPALEQALTRTDALRASTSEEWTRDMISAALDLLDPASPTRLSVSIGYDEAIAHMPSVSLELTSDSEDEGGAVAADEMASSFELINEAETDTPEIHESLLVQRTTEGIDWTSEVLIGCYDPVPERAILIQALVRLALFRMKHALQDAGVRDIVLRGGAIAPDPRMEPRVGYVPTVNVTLRWTFRTTRSTLVPNRVTIGAGTFTS